MRHTLLALALACGLQASAQDTLSASDFYNLSYQLSPTLNVKDSAALDAQFRRVAPQLLSDVRPFLLTPLRDSSILADVYGTLVVAEIYNGNFTNAIALADKARVRMYRTRYSSPPFLIARAYAMGRLSEAMGGSFGEGVTMSVEHDLALVDPAFRKDVASGLRGRITQAFAAGNGADARKYLQVAIDAGGAMEIGNMPYVMELFLNRYFVGKESERIQRSLKVLAPEEVVREAVRIPMRDGIRLNAFLFRDKASKKKLPVLIMQSPYPSGSEARQGNIYAINGYVFLYVDCRGRRASEGQFFPYENDARDYYDIINWAVKQPWCNGVAGTTGGSYLGFAQWQAIRKEYRHPALKAINPMVSVGFGVDFPRFAGGFYPYILRWADYVDGKDLHSERFENGQFWKQKTWELYRNRLPFARYDSVTGIRNAFFTKWLQHPDFDGYWKGILPKDADYQGLDIPVLSTTGYYDDDQVGALFYYRNHLRLRTNANHHVLIGPFDHGGSQWMPSATQAGVAIDDEAIIPIYKHVIGWFDWALKGAPLPAFFKDKATYYDPGSRSWKGAASVDAISSNKLVFHPGRFEAGATLFQKDNADTTFAYVHDLWTVLDSASYFHPRGDSAKTAFNPGLTLVSAPLERDYVLLGAPRADLQLSVNVPDADIDLFWMLELPDGTRSTLDYDMARLRYRRAADRPVLMQPGVADGVPFTNALFVAEKLPKGARIVVKVLVRNDANGEKNWGYGGVVSEERGSGPRPVELKLLAAGSSFTLPVQ
ncbi:MAG: CocE/NonD family hydrolase [Chitinophagaceae bacterium]|nr:MAG: CocE/NonD family hydrolase [Chitinophagaceae bacterium]